MRNRSMSFSQVTHITALGRSQLGTDTRQRPLLNFLMRISSTEAASSTGTPSKEAVQPLTLIAISAQLPFGVALVAAYIPMTLIALSLGFLSITEKRELTDVQVSEMILKYFPAPPCIS